MLVVATKNLSSHYFFFDLNMEDMLESIAEWTFFSENIRILLLHLFRNNQNYFMNFLQKKFHPLTLFSHPIQNKSLWESPFLKWVKIYCDERANPIAHKLLISLKLTAWSVIIQDFPLSNQMPEIFH